MWPHPLVEPHPRSGLCGGIVDHTQIQGFGHCCAAAALDLSRSKCNKAAVRNRWAWAHRRKGSVGDRMNFTRSSVAEAQESLAIGPCGGDSVQGVCAETCTGGGQCNCFINDTSWINDWPTQCSTRRECGQVPFARVRSLVCALNPCGCYHVRLSPASRHLRICAFAS